MSEHDNKLIRLMNQKKLNLGYSYDEIQSFWNDQVEEVKAKARLNRWQKLKLFFRRLLKN